MRYDAVTKLSANGSAAFNVEMKATLPLAGTFARVPDRCRSTGACDVLWTSWRLKSPATKLMVHQYLRRIAKKTSQERVMVEAFHVSSWITYNIS